jgi:hypothetical protein
LSASGAQKNIDSKYLITAAQPQQLCWIVTLMFISFFA